MAAVTSIATNILYPQEKMIEAFKHQMKRPGSMDGYRKRAVLKNGNCNVYHRNLHTRWLRFLRDPYTTLVDMQWRWNLLIFSLSYILSWVGFTPFWWLIADAHEDFEDRHLPDNQEQSGWVPCFTNLHDFTSTFLFSIEVQTTLGYSIRMVTDECPEAIFLVAVQFIFGIIQSTFVVGFFYAKMTRTKLRTQTVLFSQKAVICQRDNSLYLMFRIGDMSKSNILRSRIRAKLLQSRCTGEGEQLEVHQSELKLRTDDCESNLFAIWPMTVIHKIDKSSPLFNISVDDLFYERFEIVVVFEGILEITGRVMQARTSYLNDEILWGRKFVSVVRYVMSKAIYEVDYSRFDETSPVATPLCSAREWVEFKKKLERYGGIPNWSKVQMRQKTNQTRKQPIVRTL